MTNQLDAAKTAEKDIKRTLESRLVFVSHTHADRSLGIGLKSLIETIFSGVVTPFISSDPGPTGGVMPGEEWYSQIQGNLREADAVWVLATPASVTRPWIYWETGVGKALCPQGIVVLRVGLAAREIPSPLSNFQSYDGLTPGGISELVGKVATQIGMKLAPVLIEDSAKKWLDIAEKHQPSEDEAGQAPHLSPERLDRLDAAIARLEAVSMPDRPRLRGRLPPRGREREESFDVEEHITGNTARLYSSAPDFVNMLETSPADTTFEVRRIDSDGDVAVRASRGRYRTTIFLDSSELESVDIRSASSKRASKVLERIAALLEASS